MIETIYVMIAVVTWLYTFVKTLQITHLTLVNFIAHELHINRADLWKAPEPVVKGKIIPCSHQETISGKQDFSFILPEDSSKSRWVKAKHCAEFS